MLNLVLAAFFLPPAQTGDQLLGSIGFIVPDGLLTDAFSFGATFLLLDLLHYIVHRCEHAVSFLWRLHALHHSDPDVDVTTSVRHHPFEYVLASAVYWLGILAFGLPVNAVAAYTMLAFATTAVQHGNIRLPAAIERLFQLLLITTELHRVHHSVDTVDANSNYGAVFSIWDRLFGTFREIDAVRQDNIVFGVSELSVTQSITPTRMILTPWLIYRAGARPP